MQNNGRGWITLMHDSPPPLTEQRDFFLTSSLRATAGARFLLKGVANHAKKR